MKAKDGQKNMDFRSRNLKEWEIFLHSLFKDGIPRSKVWHSNEDIISVLNKLGEIDSLNHLFFPTGGGFDLNGAKLSFEKGCLELNCDGLAYIVKPDNLTFESFGDNYEWAYFRLENLQLKPSGIYDELTFDHEELLELSPLEYVDRGIWDQGFWEYDEHGNEVPFPKGARIIIRILSGSMVIFAKASIYNRTPSTYDGRHNKMSAIEFRNHIQGAIDYLNSQKS